MGFLHRKKKGKKGRAAAGEAKLMSLAKFVRRSVSRQPRWQSWHKEHFEFLRDYLAPKVGYEAAEQLANDTLVGTFENAFQFSGKRARGYLTAAADRKADAELQRQKKFVAFDEPDEFGYTLDDKGELGLSFIVIAEFEDEVIEVLLRVKRQLPAEEQVMADHIALDYTIAECAERMGLTFRQARSLHDDTIMDLRDGILAEGFAMKAEWAPKLLHDWAVRILTRAGLLPRSQSARQVARSAGKGDDAGEGGVAA